MSNSLRSQNLNDVEILAHIKNVLVINSKSYSGIRIRCVAIQTNGDKNWRNALCIITAFSNEAIPEKSNSLKYERVHLLEMWIDEQNIIPFVEEVSKQKIRVADEDISLGQYQKLTQIEFLPGNNDYSPYPGSLYQSSSSESLSIPNEPLLAYDLPFYPNPYEAISSWSQIIRFPRSSDPRIGGILLFLPESRARFKSFKQTDDKLIIEVILSDHSISSLRIKGAWQNGGTLISFESSISDLTTSIDMPSQVEEFEIYLIGPDGQLYDYRKETRFWTASKDRIIQSINRKEPAELALQNAIEQGEGEGIEFKPYVEPKDSKKFDEVIKTTIAFANTKGGTIFIGVDNQCVIRGIEVDLAKTNPQEKRETAIKNYVGQVRQNIVGVLNKNLVLNLYLIEVDSHIVLGIDIPEGEDKPYANIRNNQIYVRRGANSVVPNPKYELPQLFQSTHQFRRLFPNK